MPRKVLNCAPGIAFQRIAQYFKPREISMTTVTLQADIKAKWPQGQSSYSPGSPEELAIIGIDLLVKELGTQAAQAFIGQVFEKYPTDHMGARNVERE